jgi:choline dehydrogenase-like flavoprotein
LELSGIGNKEILDAAGIETRVHLPGVGNNVQEHMFADVTCGTRLHIRNFKIAHSPAELRPEMASEYLTFDLLNDATEARRQREL